MREIIYKYNSRGSYQTEQDTAFNGETKLKIIVEPHQFSLSVGGDELRSTSFDGCEAIVSCDGQVEIYDMNGNVVGNAAKSDGCFKKVVFKWNKEYISFEFGYVGTVDYYPNCDGEYDRYGTEWVAEYTVRINLADNSVVLE